MVPDDLFGELYAIGLFLFFVWVAMRREDRAREEGRRFGEGEREHGRKK